MGRTFEMDVPPAVRVPICICQGSIYHYHIKRVNHDGSQYEGDRFFIVMNKCPKTDEWLYMVTITRKADNQKRMAKLTGEDSSTIVPITKSDFPKLSQDSVVNCNSIHTLGLKELIKKIQDGGKDFQDNLPNSVISALISGVLKSKEVASEIKQKLL